MACSRGVAAWWHVHRATEPVLDLNALQIKIKTFGVAMGGWLAVSHRHQRGAVPVAADVSGRLPG
ncbi:MAG: hypothetical protein CBARDMAM_4480 [uncultured Caballeronia sp.]|nr:MAG: hypothetical protein CBARDMAM_4480 [uncultured Caballeronia sp.]